MYAVTGKNGYCTRCGPTEQQKAAEAVRAAFDSSAPVAGDLAGAARRAGALVGLPDGLDGSTAPRLDPATRDALAAQLNSAAVELVRLQEETAKKQRELKDLVMSARSQNRTAWNATTANLVPGELIAVGHADKLVCLESVRSDGVLIVTTADFIPNDGTRPPRPREVPFSSVVAANPRVVAATNEANRAAAAREAALEAAPCPSGPCSKCGHVLCYDYHHSDLSDMGGWALLCASPTCSCFKCTRARRIHPQPRADETTCCRCSPPDRRECNCRVCEKP